MLVHKLVWSSENCLFGPDCDYLRVCWCFVFLFATSELWDFVLELLCDFILKSCSVSSWCCSACCWWVAEQFFELDKLLNCDIRDGELYKLLNCSVIYVSGSYHTEPALTTLKLLYLESSLVLKLVLNCNQTMDSSALVNMHIEDSAHCLIPLRGKLAWFRNNSSGDEFILRLFYFPYLVSSCAWELTYLVCNVCN